MRAFKAGDKVKRVRDLIYFEMCGGKADKVYTVTKSDDYSIQLDNIKPDDNGFIGDCFELVEEESKFQVGDKVRIKGGQYVWTVIDVNGSYDVMIKLGEFSMDIFPNLIELVERAPKLVEKSYEAWMNVYPYPVAYTLHSSQISADLGASRDRITCVKLTGTAMVPEDNA